MSITFKLSEDKRKRKTAFLQSTSLLLGLLVRETLRFIIRILWSYKHESH